MIEDGYVGNLLVCKRLYKRYPWGNMSISCGVESNERGNKGADRAEPGLYGGCRGRAAVLVCAGGYPMEHGRLLPEVKEGAVFSGPDSGAGTLAGSRREEITGLAEYAGQAPAEAADGTAAAEKVSNTGSISASGSSGTCMLTGSAVNSTGRRGSLGGTLRSVKYRKRAGGRAILFRWWKCITGSGLNCHR